MLEKQRFNIKIYRSKTATLPFIFMITDRAHYAAAMVYEDRQIILEIFSLDALVASVMFMSHCGSVLF
jgi:hypothetical protein